MKLKYKYIIAVTISGLILLLFGFLRKVMHHAGADAIIKSAFYFLAGAAALLLLKVLLNTDKNHFLNK